MMRPLTVRRLWLVSDECSLPIKVTFDSIEMSIDTIETSIDVCKALGHQFRHSIEAAI